MKRALAIVTLLVSAIPSVAEANEGGLAGYTGKPYATLPQGQSCNQCHQGGTAPTVTLDGPTSLDAGQLGSYTLTVVTGQRSAGGVAASDGVTLTAGSGFRDSFGEMVQRAPQTGTGTFKFTMTAPAYGGTVRLWGVGMEANGSGTGGDKAAHLTKDVAIVGPPAPADAGVRDSGSPGGPPPSSGDGLSTPTSSTGGTAGGAAHAGSEEEEGSGEPASHPSGGRSLGGPEAGACSAAPSIAWSHALARGGYPTAIALTLVLLGMVRRRRMS